MSPDKIEALVVGAGPAGLMAADVWSSAGRQVVLVDAMPSIGRKFLMAGKSGLNLTKDQPMPDFLLSYPNLVEPMRAALADFGPEEVVQLAHTLGIPIFTGSTGRVFPTVMKASPFLRAWVARLLGQGVEIRTRWRWTGWDRDDWLFDTPEGRRRVRSDTTLMALGGASWQRLGSDGRWADIFRDAGVTVNAFAPANVGFAVKWSDHMRQHFGAPVKGTALSAGALRSRGEWVVSEKGIEGGGVYEVSQSVREGNPLVLDLMPDVDLETVTKRLSKPRGKSSFGSHLRKTLGISPIARALLMEFGRPLPKDPADVAALIKALGIMHDGPLPMDGAISTAGGIAWSALDGFEIKERPGTYVAGEMLDWEAPTGGYLITGCLATGRAAALQALGQRLSE